MARTLLCALAALLLMVVWAAGTLPSNDEMLYPNPLPCACSDMHGALRLHIAQRGMQCNQREQQLIDYSKVSAPG